MGHGARGYLYTGHGAGLSVLGPRAVFTPSSRCIGPMGTPAARFVGSEDILPAAWLWQPATWARAPRGGAKSPSVAAKMDSAQRAPQLQSRSEAQGRCAPVPPRHRYGEPGNPPSPDVPLQRGARITGPCHPTAPGATQGPLCVLSAQLRGATGWPEPLGDVPSVPGAASRGRRRRR